MLQELFNNIVDFFENISGEMIDLIGMWASIAAFTAAVTAVIIILVLFNRQQRKSYIKEMITILSSFDLLYYNLEKHFKFWKNKEKNTPNPEAREFWRKINFTRTVSSMQDLKSLSKVYCQNRANIEILSLLEFLGDIILISFRGVDLSKKDYKKEEIISSDDFEIQINKLVKTLSRSIGIRTKRTPDKEVTKQFIRNHFLNR